MDASRFDAIVASLSRHGSSRRRALTALAGVACGGLLAQFRLVPAAAENCLPFGSPCGRLNPGSHGRPPPCCSGVCSHGKCDCPPGKVRCGGVCLRPRLCPDCLGLGDTCASSAECCGRLICHGSGQGTNVCDCPGAQVACRGRCVDTARDVANCGSCGHACPSGQTCANGACCVRDGHACDGGGCCSGICCAGVCCPADEVCGGNPEEPACCVANGEPCKDTCTDPSGVGGGACAGPNRCCSRSCVDGLCAEWQ